MADWLSKWGGNLEEDMVVLELPPAGVTGLIEKDANGVEFPRVVKGANPSVT